MQTPFQVITPGMQTTRHTRTPNFPHAGVMLPWAITPQWLHPVLPGETLDRVMWKMRAVSQPVNHPLMGAWLESFLFYVKFTDIDRDLGEMFISDTFSAAPYTRASSSFSALTQGGQVDWVKMCMDRIVTAHFTNENETPRAYTEGSMSDVIYQAKVRHSSWFQNMIFYDDATGAATGTTADEVAEQIRTWQMAQLMEMDELTYEKYLKQYGVQSINTAKGDPEPLRYSREWVMPANTIDPSTGAPSSAWVFNTEVGLDKPKKFTEPGFIVAVSVVRPKVYSTIAPMIGNLWGFSDWYPAYNLADPTAGMKQIDTDDEVFDRVTNVPVTPETLVYDHRDLLSHGEQFLNAGAAFSPHPPYMVDTHDLTTGLVEDLRGEYVQDLAAALSTIFVDSGSLANDNGKKLIYDGHASLSIKGHIVDTTR